MAKQVLFKFLTFSTGFLFLITISLPAIAQNSADYQNRSVLQNWIEVNEKVHSEIAKEEDIENSIPYYDRLARDFFQLYKEKQNVAYLNFAIHEAAGQKREKILNNLSENELQEISSIVNKVANNQLDSTYFEIRDFNESDIYFFKRINIPQEFHRDAQNLLDHWYSRLDETLDKDLKLGSFKAQTIVNGFYVIDDLEKVHAIGKTLISNHPFPESTFTIDLFNFVSFSSRIYGYYKDALDTYREELLPMTESIGSQEQYLRTRMDYANVLFRIGNVSASKREYEYVFSQDHTFSDSRYQSALINNLAVSYLNSGNFDRYVEFQLNAYEIANEQDNISQQLTILRNLFNFYRRQGESSTASTYINRALDLARETGEMDELASLIIPYGVHLRESENELEGAKQEFHEALRLSKEYSDYQNQYSSHLQLGITYQASGRYKESEQQFILAKELSNQRNDDTGYTEANVLLANFYINKGDFESAKNILNRFESEDFYVLGFNRRVNATNAEIKLLRNNGNLQEAVEKSEHIIDQIINWLRESMDRQTGHMRMDRQFAEAFRIYTNLMHQTGNYANALSKIGELRDISRSGFYNNPLLKSKVLSDEELIYDYALGNRIQRLRRNISEATEQERISINNELLNAISERNRLQNRALPRAQEEQVHLQITDIQNNLTRDQAVFYFSIFEDQIFRFLITRSDIDLTVFPHDDAFITLLRDGTRTLGRERTNLSDLHDIYSTFFDVELPASVSHIFMIPDNEFYRLPIEILPVDPVSSPFSYGSANYLLENFSVSYANSLSELIRDDTESPSFEYDIAGFGIRNFTQAGYDNLSDLPFSPREIRESVNRLDRFSNRTFFLDEESTRENFISKAGNSKILHVATHSKVNDENPLFSTLYLHPGANSPDSNPSSNTNDAGIMYAYELFDLNMNAELVFLSSCESGSGGYLSGSGVLGFSRAISYAGAKSLLMNLWPVRDQTASTISLTFYDEINKGSNKADALQTARLSYLNNTNSDPYLWGTFVLYGDIDSPIGRERMLPINVVILALLIVGFIALSFITYKRYT